MLVVAKNTNNIIVNVENLKLHCEITGNSILAVTIWGNEYIAYSGYDTPVVYDRLLTDIINHKIKQDSIIKFHAEGYDIYDY